MLQWQGIGWLCEPTLQRLDTNATARQSQVLGCMSDINTWGHTWFERNHKRSLSYKTIRERKRERLFFYIEDRKEFFFFSFVHVSAKKENQGKHFGESCHCSLDHGYGESSSSSTNKSWNILFVNNFTWDCLSCYKSWPIFYFYR